jgi:CopG family nickel-responsive transcriptional regulator
MAIVSISMDDNLLRELEDLQREMGFSGRSDIIRSAVRSFISENRGIKQHQGTEDAVLIGVHEQSAEQRVTEIKHEHEDIIKTQTHTHISPNRCLEIFVLHGGSEEIEELYRDCQRSDSMDYLRMFYA